MYPSYFSVLVMDNTKAINPNAQDVAMVCPGKRYAGVQTRVRQPLGV